MFLEGDRLFDIVWGTVSGLLCLSVAVPMLWWWLPEHRRSFFGTAIDPQYRLQLAYGLFGMGMFGTNIGCRYIPHGWLEYVHPTFALLTVLLLVGLGPRVIFMAYARTPRTAAPE
jgi:hypothetical protein